jgi:AcrR family transcriptional regulator
MERMKEAVAFKPRRGRPSAKQVAAIDAAILQAAKTMFLEDGFDQAAMESVIAKTGVSKSTLYARYPSKEDLFSAVIEASVQEWSKLSSVDDDQLTDDIGQRLHHHARTIARSLTMQEIQAFRRILLATQDRFPRLASAMYTQAYGFILNLLTRDIEDAALRDNRPVADARGVAERLIGAIVGWHLQESMVRDVPLAELLGFADRTADIMLAGRTVW